MAQEVGMSGQTKLTLWCGVFDDQSILSVDVERNANVLALKKVIFTEKRYAERYRFDASRLKLFLARTPEGAWLQGADADGVLAGKPDDTEYKLMKPFWRLSKPEFFGGVEIGEDDEEIHVLVQLPDDAAGGVVEASAVANAVNKLGKTVKDFRDEMAEFRDRMVGAKHKRIVHSEMNSTKGNALLQDLNIRMRSVNTVPFQTGPPTPVRGFAWVYIPIDENDVEIPLTEEQQRERYRLYVKDPITDVLRAKNLCLLGVEKGRNILTVKIPGTDITLAGRTDMLVLSASVEEHPSQLDLLPDVRLLIEVKRSVEPGAQFQAMSELIALDFLVEEPVMALLTNMTNHWQFFWVAEKSANHAIIQTTIIEEASVAFAVIRALLEQSPAVDITLPSFQQPVKRRKLANVLPTISES